MSRFGTAFISTLVICSLLILGAKGQLRCGGDNNPQIIPRDCAKAFKKFHQSQDGRITYPFHTYSRSSGSCMVTLTTQNSGNINVDGFTASSGLTEVNTKCSGTGSAVLPHGSTKGGAGDTVLLEVDQPPACQVA